ncbi:hypothetical protein D3C72_1488520 [compost metagenome]
MVINSKLDEANDDVLDESYRDKLEILSSAVRERFATQDSYAYVEDFDDRALVYCTPEGTYTIDYHFEGENPILTGESKPVVVETSYKVKTNSVMARLKAVVEYFSTKTNQPVVQVNTPEEKDMTPEEVQAIVDKAVGAAVDAVNLKLNSSEAQVKSLQEALQANSDSLLKDKRAAVAKVHGEVVANALSGEALDAMYVGVQTAAGILSGSVATNAKDEFEGYSLNQADQEAK